LKNIIDKAQEFRAHIAPLCNPVVSTPEEIDTQRFYLRKLEGAEILLAFETNFFRQELHKWNPVADEPPPVLEESKSTRKPRPTKLQKILQQYGVDNPDDLPDSVRGKANSLKRKQVHIETQHTGPGSGYSAGHGSASSPGRNPYSAGTLFSRSSSDQPQTPGLSVASSSHAHPSRGPDSSTSSVHGHARTDSGGQAKDDIALSTHPSFFAQDGAGAGPQLLVASDANPALSLEERLLRGQMPEEVEIEEALSTEAGIAKAKEILSRTEEGRRRAEELFGEKASKGGELSGAPPEDVANEGDVDRLFADMTNQDDDEEGGGKAKEDKDVAMPDAPPAEKAPATTSANAGAEAAATRDEQ
jgi:histone demethylase JARID1